MVAAFHEQLNSRCVAWRGLAHRSAIVLLCLMTQGPAANGQDERDPDEPPAEVNLQNVHFEIPANQFDAWVFQHLQNAKVAREHLEKLLSLRTDDVDRGCKLADNQRKKLQLAGQGDIKRFFEQVERVQKKFEVARMDQNKLNLFWQEMQPIQTMVQSGLYVDDSLFQKTLRNMLSGEQLAQYSKHESERRTFVYRARIELAVSVLENVLPLRDEQRQKLIALTVEQTKPPKQFGQQDYYVVLFMMSKVPESKLKPLFGQSEWNVLRQQFAQAQGMEAFLRQNGILDDSQLEVRQ